MAGLKDISKKSGVTVDDIRSVFDAVTVTIAEGNSVKIPTFGTFAPKIEEPRTIKSSILPNGEAKTPRRRVIRYKMSDKLREDWRME